MEFGEIDDVSHGPGVNYTPEMQQAAVYEHNAAVTGYYEPGVPADGASFSGGEVGDVSHGPGVSYTSVAQQAAVYDHNAAVTGYYEPGAPAGGGGIISISAGANTMVDSTANIVQPSEVIGTSAPVEEVTTTLGAPGDGGVIQSISGSGGTQPSDGSGSEGTPASSGNGSGGAPASSGSGSGGALASSGSGSGGTTQNSANKAQEQAERQARAREAYSNRLQGNEQAERQARAREAYSNRLQGNEQAERQAAGQTKKPTETKAYTNMSQDEQAGVRAGQQVYDTATNLYKVATTPTAGTENMSGAQRLGAFIGGKAGQGLNNLNQQVSDVYNKYGYRSNDE